MTARTDRIAERICADWWDRAPHRNLSGDAAPADLAEAYEIQRAVQTGLSTRRGALAGRKIALSSAAMQQMVGISHPIAGAFFEKDIHDSPAVLDAAQFRHLGLEFELALTIGRDCVPGEVHDRESAQAMISAARPAFELIEDRGADYSELDVLSLIADNAWCGGVVLGPEIPGWRALDLGALDGAVHEEGCAVEHVRSGAADPLGSLAWVLNHANDMGTPVRAGEVVITGSATRTRFPKAGAHIVYELAGASVAVSLRGRDA